MLFQPDKKHLLLAAAGSGGDDNEKLLVEEGGAIAVCLGHLVMKSKYERIQKRWEDVQMELAQPY